MGSTARSAAQASPEKIVDDVKKLVGRVRSQKRVPSFVDEAIQTLEDLIGPFMERAVANAAPTHQEPTP